MIVTLLPEAVAHWRKATEPVVETWLKDMKEAQDRRRQNDRQRACAAWRNMPICRSRSRRKRRRRSRRPSPSRSRLARPVYTTIPNAAAPAVAAPVAKPAPPAAPHMATQTPAPPPSIAKPAPAAAPAPPADETLFIRRRASRRQLRRRTGGAGYAAAARRVGAAGAKPVPSTTAGSRSDTRAAAAAEDAEYSALAAKSAALGSGSRITGSADSPASDRKGAPSRART